MSFARSDLAAECGATHTGEGVRVHEEEQGGCRICRVRICDEAAAARIGKPVGRYVTLMCESFALMNAEESERVRCALAVELRSMAERMCERRITPQFSVLVAGLGNADITPDALGPLTVSHLTVTRDPSGAQGGSLEVVGRCRMSALAVGVSARTGLESAEILRGAVRETHPDLIVAVDALAARDAARLGSTVQISDTGIRPGSGIGARHTALCAESCGVPVLALGVPTVVDAATLVYDALTGAGYGELTEELRHSLAARRRFFVTPRDADLMLSGAAILLASALEKAFSQETL